MTIKIRTTAEGVDAGIASAKRSLEGLNGVEAERARVAKDASRQASQAYRLAAIEAQKLATAAKYAGESEKESLQKSAREAAKVAAEKDTYARLMQINAEQEEFAAEKVARANQEAGKASSDAAREGALSYAALAAAAVKAFTVIVSAVQQGLSVHKEYVAATKGLESVATGKGFGAEETREALDGVSDAFLDATSAATAFKNLLSRGYTLDQARETLDHIKNSAVYNRQAHYGFAEAVVATTEGIRNENSVMADASGVTKNLAKMWEEYAKSLGVATTELTQAQKIEAELIGFREGTAAAMGDMLKMSTDLAGAEARAAAEGKELARGFGEAMAPTAQLLTDIFGGLVGVIGDIAKESPELTAGLTGAAGSMLLVVGASKGMSAVSAMVKMLTSDVMLFGVSLSTAMPWLAAIGVVIGASVSMYTAIANAEKRAAEELKAYTEEMHQLGGKRDEIRELSMEYNALIQKTSKSGAEKSRITEIEQMLASKYDMTTHAIRDQIDAMNGLEEAGKGAGESAAIDAASQSLERYQRLLAKQANDRNRMTERAKYKSNEEAMASGFYAEIIESGADAAINGILAKAPAISEATAKALGDAYRAAVAKNPAQNYGEEFLNGFIDSMSGADVTKAFASIGQEFQDGVRGAMGADGFLQEDEFHAFSVVLGKLRTNVSETLAAIGQMYGLTSDEIAAMTDRVVTGHLKAIGAIDEEAASYAGLNVEQLLLEKGQQAQLERDREMLAATQANGKAIGYNAAEWSKSVQEMSGNYGELLREAATYKELLADVSTLQAKGATDVDRKTAQQRLEQAGYIGVADSAEALAAAQAKITANAEQTAEAISAQSQSMAEAETELRTLQERQGDSSAIRLALASIEYAKTQSVDAFQVMLDTANQSAGELSTTVEGMVVDVNELLSAMGFDTLFGSLQDIPALFGSIEERLVSLKAQQAEYESQGMRPPEGLLESIRQLEQLRTGIVQLNTAASKVSSLEKLDREVKSLAANRTTAKNLLDIANAAKASGTAFSGLSPKLQTYIRDHQMMDASIDQVIAALQAESGQIDQATANFVQDITAQRDEWYRTKTAIESGAIGRFTADGSDLMAEADAAITILNTLLRLLGLAGGDATETKETKGGGGGGKKDKAEEAKREAEEARKAQEEAWQRELDEQLRVLERKKRLGEINTQEEIRQLEIILKKYAKTAEQKLQIEEKLFEARMALRDEEIAELDKLNDGILTALRARYEEQRRIEEERLDSSAEGWRAWADKNVNSIQAQIDALDELTKTEDREAQDAAKRRKIDATRQMLEYTHDEANADQLRKELERLEAEYAKWQRGNAIADEKERLRAEQEAFRTRAEAEQDALEKLKDATGEQYDALLQDASLRAEAERMLAQANQEDILALIGSYTPDYEATGKSLGERLYAGMESVLGNISSWFEAFNSQIAGIQAQIAQTALGAVDAHYAGQQAGASGASAAAPTEVHQTLNFYEPVESPADTARKLREANEALGAQLAQ